LKKILAIILIGVLAMGGIAIAQEKPKSLYDLYFNVLKKAKFVDLTHAFDEKIPHWPGFPEAKREILYWYAKGEGVEAKMGYGFFAEYFSHVGQWGTHMDPPCHFHKGLRSIDQIDVKEMLLPLVVIDVHEKVAKNPDYQVSMEDIKAWEGKYGPIPEGAFVALRTDWSKRWPSMEAMQNKDEKGVAHYPGWSMEVLKYLFEERKVTAIGHETTDTDPGIATSKGDYSLEAYVFGSGTRIWSLSRGDSTEAEGRLRLPRKGICHSSGVKLKGRDSPRVPPL